MVAVGNDYAPALLAGAAVNEDSSVLCILHYAPYRRRVRCGDAYDAVSRRQIPGSQIDKSHKLCLSLYEVLDLLSHLFDEILACQHPVRYLYIIGF